MRKIIFVILLCGVLGVVGKASIKQAEFLPPFPTMNVTQTAEFLPPFAASYQPI